MRLAFEEEEIVACVKSGYSCMAPLADVYGFFLYFASRDGLTDFCS